MIFYKADATGNTFVIALESEATSKLNKKSLAIKLCDTRTGVAADGLLLLSRAQAPFDYAWDFYNSDGSKAEMCGNAARAAARLVYDKLNFNVSQKIRFLTGAGLVEVFLQENNQFIVQMPQPSERAEVTTLQAGQFSRHGLFVDTGVPHFVIEVNEENEVSAKECAELRRAKETLPQGANITLVRHLDAKTTWAKTFERGVENFTLSCGTGAVAAAFSAHRRSREKLITVKMPGGDLVVDMHHAHPTLMGPAEISFEFKI